MNDFVDQLLSKYDLITQQRVNEIRSLVLSSSDRVQEKYKYNTAFYNLDNKHPICYITIKPNIIIVGLIQGKVLSTKFATLYGKQKQVRHLNATQNNNDEILATIILESIFLIDNK